MAFTGDIDFRAKGIDFKYVEGMTALPAEIMVSAAANNGNAVTFTGLDGTVSTYNLLKKLNAGTYGQTWACGDNKVIKIIKPRTEYNTVANYVFDVIQEAMMQIIIFESSKGSKISAFCPEIYIVGKDKDNNLYIVNDQLNATVYELFDSYYNDKLIETRFIKIAKDLAFILHNLYDSLKFNHRDLHVSNVMVKFNNDNSISVKLIDFGYSCMSYKNILFAPKSKDIYGSDLTCRSEIRDMHMFLSSALDSRILQRKIYTSLTKLEITPIHKIVQAICASDITLPENAGERYLALNASNSIGSPNAALNCHPNVVFNIFSSLEMRLDIIGNQFKPDWAKHLVKLYISTYKHLTYSEFYFTTEEARADSLLPYLTSILPKLWSTNISNDFLAKDECRIDTSAWSVFKAPPELISALFEKFIAQKLYLQVDGTKETILFKLARNITEPDVEDRFMRVVALLDTEKYTMYDIFFKLNNKGENVYELIKAATATATAAALEIEERSVEFIDSLNPNSLNASIPDSAFIVLRSLTKFDFFSKHVEQALVISTLIINNISSKLNGVFKTLIEKMSPDIGDIKISVTEQHNLLEYALLKNNVFAARILVDTGATFDTKDKSKLFFLISQARFFTKDLLVAILKSCGADNALINHRNEKHWTPLMAAAFNRNYDAVQALGEVPGALFTLQDNEGNTCLHLVSGKNGYDRRDAAPIINYLIGKRPELVDIKNNDGLGPGNPKWVAAPPFRDLIKAKKSMFGKYPNTEKGARDELTTGGRKTTRRCRHKRSTKRYKRPAIKQSRSNRDA